MIAVACGCGNSVCACKIQGGSNVTVTGVGSTGNPYVISSSGGGGGSSPIMTTIAGINTLATAGSLVPGQLYGVTDWHSGTGGAGMESLPGPNILWVEADDAHTPSKFVRVETPLGAIGPAWGEFLWNVFGSANLMTRLADGLNNVVEDFNSGQIDAFVWGQASFGWTNNRIGQTTTFTGGYAATSAAAAAGMTFTDNDTTTAGPTTIDLTGCTGGVLAHLVAEAGGQVQITSGAAAVNVQQCRGACQGGLTVETGAVLTACEAVTNALITVRTGGQITQSRVSCGATLDTGAFTHDHVFVDGPITATLTAPNSGTYAGFGTNTLV